ncbi:phage/plasmid primase, P4 family [Desulfovibrio sp. QI0442]
MHQNAPTIVNSACKMQSPPSTANAEGEKNQKAIVKCSVKGLATDVNPPLAAALAYAEAGKPVCPFGKYGEKRPFTEHGIREASTNPAQIRKWWGEHPNAWVALASGKDAGFFVLDVDRPKFPGDADGFDTLRELEEKYGPLPVTASETSPSGGKHFFFKYVEGLSSVAGYMGPKLDIRSDGYPIIVAPSVTDRGNYTAGKPIQEFIADLNNVAEAPAWFIERAKKKEAPKAKKTKAQPQKNGNTPYGKKALAGEVAKIEAACEGERNDTLYSAGVHIGQLVGSGHLGWQFAYDELIAPTAHWGEDRKSADTLRRALDAGIQNAEQQKADGKSDLTEDLLALAFTDRYANKFSFCHGTGAWFVWNGQCWQKDQTRMPLQAMRELCREMNQPQKAIFGKLVTASGALKFAAGDRRMAVAIDEWDTDPMLIGTPGGIVDLRTGILAQGDPAQRITKLAGIAPSEKADCPMWLQFLEEATDGDKGLQRFMQQMAGYCLTGQTKEHALFFIYGPGGNGKSVFLNILTALLAQYATTSAMTTFTASNNDQHPTDLAMLKGARLVCVSETEDGRAWAESRIKQLTGGDKITARFMRQDFFEFTPQFKLVIVGNHQPILRNVDAAARRRFNIIPFVHTPINPDSELESKLKAELPGIMRWAIDGCLDWQSNGLVRPEVVLAATDEYFESQDLFGRWFEEQCDTSDKKAWIATKDLYASWAAYARRSGEEPGDVRRFGPMIARRGLPPKRIKVDRGFSGVCLIKTDGFDEFEV